jgi:hypothetical protein
LAARNIRRSSAWSALSAQSLNRVGKLLPQTRFMRLVKLMLQDRN